MTVMTIQNVNENLCYFGLESVVDTRAFKLNGLPPDSFAALAHRGHLTKHGFSGFITGLGTGVVSAVAVLMMSVAFGD